MRLVAPPANSHGHIGRLGQSPRPPTPDPSAFGLFENAAGLNTEVGLEEYFGAAPAGYPRYAWKAGPVGDPGANDGSEALDDVPLVWTTLAGGAGTLDESPRKKPAACVVAINGAYG